MTVDLFEAHFRSQGAKISDGLSIETERLESLSTTVNLFEIR